MNAAQSFRLAEAYAHCRNIARREAKNFFYAFRVLPRHKSDAMCAVYAFMRKADDLADDESLSLDERRSSMASWTEAWRASREHASDDLVFLAVADTQRRFGIPVELLESLVAGTTLDLQPEPDGVMTVPLAEPKFGRTSVQIYEDFSALRQYCYLVASVVGLVCIHIFGYKDEHAEEYAIDTGIAFQLTNILRDVKEDAERGRIYLPADRLAEYGMTPDSLLRVLSDGKPGRTELEMVMGLQGTAQKLYRQSEKLIPLLDRDSRAAMRVLVRIYRRLLDRVANDPEAIFRKRVSVPAAQKITILSRGMVESAVNRVAR